MNEIDPSVLTYETTKTVKTRQAENYMYCNDFIYAKF